MVKLLTVIIFTLIVFAKKEISKISQMQFEKISSLLQNQFKEKLEINKKQSFHVASENFLFVTTKSKQNNNYKFLVVNSDISKTSELKPSQECAVTNIFQFKKVEGVGFYDMNGDGKLDILSILSFLDNRPSQGDGVGNLSKHNIGVVYLSQNQGFTLLNDCFEVSSLKKLRKKAKQSLSSNS